ncbi:MAG: hypothetical protein ACOYEP_01935 [Limnochordia bacterium]|jgi:hypothetical protein
MTKYNPRRKEHHKADLDRRSVRGSERGGAEVVLDAEATVRQIAATGRGSRPVCQMDRHGFPHSRPKVVKRVNGLNPGDLIGRFVVEHLVFEIYRFNTGARWNRWNLSVGEKEAHRGCLYLDGVTR